MICQLLVVVGDDDVNANNIFWGHFETNVEVQVTITHLSLKIHLVGLVAKILRRVQKDTKTFKGTFPFLQFQTGEDTLKFSAE